VTNLPANRTQTEKCNKQYAC